MTIQSQEGGKEEEDRNRLPSFGKVCALWGIWDRLEVACEERQRDQYNHKKELDRDQGHSGVVKKAKHLKLRSRR